MPEAPQWNGGTDATTQASDLAAKAPDARGFTTPASQAAESYRDKGIEKTEPAPTGIGGYAPSAAQFGITPSPPPGFGYSPQQPAEGPAEGYSIGSPFQADAPVRHAGGADLMPYGPTGTPRTAAGSQNISGIGRPPVRGGNDPMSNAAGLGTGVRRR